MVTLVPDPETPTAPKLTEDQLRDLDMADLTNPSTRLAECKWSEVPGEFWELYVVTDQVEIGWRLTRDMLDLAISPRFLDNVLDSMVSRLIADQNEVDSP